MNPNPDEPDPMTPDPNKPEWPRVGAFPTLGLAENFLAQLPRLHKHSQNARTPKIHPSQPAVIRITSWNFSALISSILYVFPQFYLRPCLQRASYRLDPCLVYASGGPLHVRVP